MFTGNAPILGKAQPDLLKKIKLTDGPLKLRGLSKASPKFVSLLEGLLNGRPEDRLGGKSDALDVMSHPFFEDIDWDLAAARKLDPPMKPHLGDKTTDFSNFASFYTKQKPVESFVNTSLSKEEKINFRNFEYNRSTTL